jgi:hypothetical protein
MGEFIPSIGKDLRSFSMCSVSPGDGGLSYGQVVVAAAMLRGRKERFPAS